MIVLLELVLQNQESIEPDLLMSQEVILNRSQLGKALFYGKHIGIWSVLTQFLLDSRLNLHH